MSNHMTRQEITDRLPEGWRLLLNRIETTVTASSYSDAGELAAGIAALADESDHHPDLDLRYPGIIHIVLTSHDSHAVTERDLAMASAITELARRAEAVLDPAQDQVIEIALDALDIDRVRPFWTALLGYVDEPPRVPGDTIRAIRDPRGINANLWFQQMDAPRTERNRFHLDVVVPHDQAEDRLAAALAAGGTLLSGRRAPAFWVLADPEGNEACICTWQSRD